MESIKRTGQELRTVELNEQVFYLPIFRGLISTLDCVHPSIFAPYTERLFELLTLFTFSPKRECLREKDRV